MATGSVAAFLSQKHTASAGPAVGANDTLGARLASDLREAVIAQARVAPRSQQVHLGPSEIGEPCDRQVVGKLAGLPTTNHVADPWPSTVGTAVHAWLAEHLEADNARWWTERRVVPIEGHSGTADLYDAETQSVIDHKILGTTTHAKIVSKGPGTKYFTQLLLYGRGYRRAGYPVRHVALAAWKRNGSTHDLYVWHHECTPQDEAYLDWVETVQLPYRKAVAEALRAGTISLLDVPASSEDSCYFCPFYRPDAATNPAAAGPSACPGIGTAPVWG